MREFVEGLKGLAGIQIERQVETRNQNWRHRGQGNSGEISTAEAEVETRLEGRERASARMFSEPEMWTVLLVNSAM